MTTVRLIPDTESSVQTGLRLARLFFAKRGNRREMHVSLRDLAAMLALAAEAGACADCPARKGGRG